MATESELRDAIRASANAATTGIDTGAVVRRARARRLPQQLAFSSLSVLAVVGVVVLGVTTLPSLLPGPTGAADSSIMSTAPESQLSDAGGDASTEHFDARGLTPRHCGTPTTRTEPHSVRLTLSAHFPDSAPAGGHNVAGTVSLTNTGTSRVSGTTTLPPTVTVSRGGVTVWHSHGVPVSAPTHIVLDPGESYSYDSSFTAVECTPDDNSSEQPLDDRTPLEPGPYEISAEIIFVPDASDLGERILVGGPPERIELY